jgi:nickel-type superoxide dismutase maturation protease
MKCRAASVAAAVPAAVALGLVVAWRGRVVVEGSSMSPTLEPGERLLVLPAWRLARGDLVTVADPRNPELVMVKRLLSVDGRGVEIAGDNPDHSTDSRQLGILPRDLVRGRAVLCYWPPPRVRRL